MKRAAVLAYGVVCYLLFLGTFLYAVGFVGDLLVPKSIDSGSVGGPGGAFATDVALLGLFAIPHSIMARAGFKQRWTQLVAPAVERSTYVLISSALLALLFWQWQPIPEVVWDVHHPVGRGLLQAVFWGGWGVVLVSTFLTDHFDLFGLRQVYLSWRQQPYTPVGFQTRALYRWVRHPLLLGFLVAFWAAPTMTVGHLLFAAATTAYVLLAVRLEERDLVCAYGRVYEDYQRQTGMFLPWPRRPAPADGPAK